MLSKENGSKAKLLDVSKTISTEKMWSEFWMQCVLLSIGLPQLKLLPHVSFLFFCEPKPFSWLNVQYVQFYWDGGDLGAFFSAWLADWEHFRSFGDMSGCEISSFFNTAKFCFLHIWPIFFFFFSNSTYIRIFNFRQILEGKSCIWLIFELTYIQEYIVYKINYKKDMQA